MKILKEKRLIEDALNNEIRELISASTSMMPQLDNSHAENIASYVMDLLNGNLKKYGLKPIKYKFL